MVRSSSSAIVVLSGATAAVASLAWFLRWRARSRAKISALLAQQSVSDGPLIDHHDPKSRKAVLNAALKRSKTWLMLLSNAEVVPRIMKGQVGGISSSGKRPILTLEPDYVLKPLQMKDHRGVREVAFYEALCFRSSGTLVHGDVEPQQSIRGVLRTMRQTIDVLAMLLCVVLQDEVVAACEEICNQCWKLQRQEALLLRRLAHFCPPYHGLVRGVVPSSSDSLHLLLGDVTANFSRPCVMDIKMGTQTYEPDATPGKISKEQAKYPSQQEFGFRLVGMRIYDPEHFDADDSGYRVFGKHFGRSLRTRREVKDALRVFFSTMSTFIHVKAIANVSLQIRLLRKWFDDNTCFCFFSSSLLIAYEGAAANDDKVTLKMIDHCHVRRRRQREEAVDLSGYKHGLLTLLELLMELLEEGQQARRDHT